MTPRAGLVALALVTVIAFSPALRGPQLFDDARALQDNPSITRLWPPGVPLHPPAGSAVSGRPVANYSLALNYAINRVAGVDQRPDPDGPDKLVSYHAVNILLHLACGLLLFGVLGRTLGNGRLGERWAPRAEPFAMVVSALWLLHPLTTDAVDYVVQRTELLAALAALATLYCSIRAWDAAGPGARRRWFAAGIAACALGMGSKEVMAGAPILVVLYDRAFRVDSWRGLLAPELRARRWFYAGLAATWLVLGTLLATTPRGVSVGFHAGIPWYEYLHSQGWAITHYLGQAVWPDALSIDYGADPVPHWRGVPGLLLLTVLGAATALAWTRTRTWGWFAFLGTAFFVLLAPSSSVVPIVTEIAAERRIYLPLAAVLIVLAVAVDAAARRLRVSLRPAAVALPAILAGLTFQRSGLYRDPALIWRDATIKVPANPRAWYNLGVSLTEDGAAHQAEADADFRHAVQLDSTYADALLRVMVSDAGRGAYADVQNALRHFPMESGNDTVLAGLGKALFVTGDTTAALLVLRRAGEQPSTVATLVTLSALYLAVGNGADGVTTLRRAVAFAPTRDDLVLDLSALLLQQGNPRLAVEYLTELVRREPGSAVYRADLDEAKSALAKQRH